MTRVRRGNGSDGEQRCVPCVVTRASQPSSMPHRLAVPDRERRNESFLARSPLPTTHVLHRNTDASCARCSENREPEKRRKENENKKQRVCTIIVGVQGTGAFRGRRETNEFANEAGRGEASVRLERSPSRVFPIAIESQHLYTPRSFSLFRASYVALRPCAARVYPLNLRRCSRVLSLV